MQLRCILVGTDGSDGARRATEWAAALASGVGGTVIAVHALGLLHRAPDGGLVASDLHRDEILRELELHWCAPLRAAGVDHRSEVREGPPVSAILQAIDDLDADVVVLGRRGAGGFPGLQLGSTSTQVAQHAPCAVVLVPTDDG